MSLVHKQDDEVRNKTFGLEKIYRNGWSEGSLLEKLTCLLVSPNERDVTDRVTLISGSLCFTPLHVVSHVNCMQSDKVNKKCKNVSISIE